MTGAWVCEPCARRLQLRPSGGPSYASGVGWCGAGQHRTGPGDRLVWHDRVANAAPAGASPVAAAPVSQPEQLILL